MIIPDWCLDWLDIVLWAVFDLTLYYPVLQNSQQLAIIAPLDTLYLADTTEGPKGVRKIQVSLFSNRRSKATSASSQFNWTPVTKNRCYDSTWVFFTAVKWLTDFAWKWEVLDSSSVVLFSYHCLWMEALTVSVKGVGRSNQSPFCKAKKKQSAKVGEGTGRESVTLCYI